MPYELEKLNALLVEDNFSMRTLLRDVLAAFGIKNVISVSDGGRAWRELRDFPAESS